MSTGTLRLKRLQYPNGTNALSIDSDGSLSTGTLAVTGNTTVSGTLVNTGLITASGGVAIGGTDAAHTLDDYEEGTWTPTVIGNGGNSGQAYSSQQGTYTKIGRQVDCRFYLILSTEGSFSGSYLRLDGFPFTISTAVQTVHLCNMYFVGLADNYISLGLQAYENTTSAFIWGKTSASGSREYLGTGDLADNVNLSGAFTYFV
tara:strand:- start:1317 stop:1925 length:609 start_codon:yes stop_codon:yes gene_type:complete